MADPPRQQRLVKQGQVARRRHVSDCPQIQAGFAIAGLNPESIQGALDLLEVAVTRQYICAK